MLFHFSVKCQNFNVCNAYHTVCGSCSEKLHICGKCGGADHDLIPKQEKVSQQDMLQRLRSEMSGLRERQRRSFLRKV